MSVRRKSIVLALTRARVVAYETVGSDLLYIL
jgi:hypothetical protein